MRTASIIAAATVLLTAFTPAGSGAQTRSATPLDMPARIGSFAIAETHRYPQEQLGTLYRYRNDSDLEPDVYVYPVGGDPENGGPLNPAREEGMNFGRVLTVQRARRRFESFEIVKSEELNHPGAPGWHTHAVITHREGKSDTHLMVFVVGDQMLKVRATFAQSSESTDDLNEFVAQLVAAVTRGSAEGG